jgi:hypothetical protein
MLGNNGPAPVRKGPRHGSLVLVAVVALGVLPMHAVAADRPTPEQLWDAYPLDPPAKGPRLEVPASSGVATPAPSREPTPAADEGSGFPVALVLGLGLGIALFATGLVLGGRRRTRPPAPAAAESPPGPRAGATCEIRWRGGIVGPHFRAVMTVPGESGAQQIARSPRVDWPPILPPTPEPQVVEAARALARELVDAGWQPEGHGDEWYSQRFAWSGAQAPQPIEHKEPVPGG